MTHKVYQFRLALYVSLICVWTLISCSQTPQQETSIDSSEFTPENTALTEIETPEVRDDLDSLAERINELTLTDFFEETHQILTLRDPEVVVELGLESFYGVQDLPLTDISDAYQRETFEVHSLILEGLQRYDFDSMTPEEQLSYRIYEWYLGEVLSGQKWMYYDYPITHFLTGVQNQLVFFFTDIHPMTTDQDAHNYYRRLTQVDDKIDQLIESLKLREQTGIVTPQRILQMSIGAIQAIADSPPKSTPFYLVFAEKLESISTISADEKEQLLGSVEDEIRQNILPAYKDLVEEVKRLIQIAPTEEGVWQFVDGLVFYNHILHHHTTLELPPEDVHQIGLNEVDRIQREIRTISGELGYPSDISFTELFSQVAEDGGVIPQDRIVSTYENILNEAKVLLSDVIELEPRMDVIVIGVNRGGFYVPGALDGSRPAAFYATVSSQGEPWFGMPTLTYHEAVPGHHLQTALTLESSLPSFRKGISFTAFNEGWALYAERLASESGWYTGDPYGNLGRLQMELFRAARLVVDTGIHAFGWKYDEALQYMIETTGMGRGFLEFEVSRYIAWPGQATSYKIGMQSILDLRQQVRDKLGEDFDLRSFHTLLISNGSPPLPILEDIVDAYIRKYKSSQ